MQVWAFCRAQAHLRKHLHSNGTLLHPGPDLDTLCPGVELLQQDRQQALKEGSWGVLGAGLSGRYGPFVGHKRSGGRFYPHMDLSPPWTRFWQPMTREGGAAGRQAAGPLGGVMGHAGLSVGHKCSRGRFYPHLEPFSTLYQNLTPRALGWGCCSRAGSRCSRRGLDVYGEQA